MPEQVELNFEMGGSILKIYQKADYSPWIAVGEWVDNAVQAYKKNKKALKKLYKEDGIDGLEVKIVYEKGKSLVVRDNSSGMNESELREAFQMGKDKNREVDDLGQNNAGMKAAALWLGEEWVIKTKKYDENEELTVKVIANDLFNDNFTLQLDKKTINDSSHYTEITITKILPKRQWGASQQTKIKKYLASMYKHWMIHDDFKLTWNDTLIQPRIVILRKDNEGKEFKWPFKASSNKNSDDFLAIEGHFAILFPADDIGELGHNKALCSGRQNAGINIYRRNRMIRGYPDTWRPERMYGSGTNDLINQRVVCEINVNDANVSQDKSNITDHDLNVIEKYLEKKWIEFDIGATAKGFKKVSKPPTKDEIEDAARRMANKYNESDLDLVLNEEVPGEGKLKAEEENAIERKDDSSKRTVRVGAYSINLYFQELGISEKYVRNEPTIEGAKHINVIINTDHPYMHNITDMEQYFDDCMFDALALYKCEEIKRSDSRAYIHNKDAVMRLDVDKGA
ncbi:MAG: ATP-binding protein [Gammaproteobacteria bacterium]|nr:ATP-binding protein [Gammaproteobacteria bacterium]